MATDRDKNHFLLGECKFKNSAFDFSEMNAALRKFKPGKETAQVYFIFFSKSGFTDDVQRSAGECGFKLVPLDKIFNGSICR